MHRSRYLAAFAAALVASVASAGKGDLARVPPGSQPTSPTGTPVAAQPSTRLLPPRSKSRHCTSLRRRKP